jgi:outer membrane protein assembly factor BamA
MKVFKVLNPASKIIKLKNDDASAELIYKTGKAEYREFYYGSGYLSQSSRVIRVPEGVVSVSITNYKGETRKISINDPGTNQYLK